MESMTPNSGWERLDVSGEDVTEELCVSSSKKKKKFVAAAASPARLDAGHKLYKLQHACVYCLLCAMLS